MLKNVFSEHCAPTEDVQCIWQVEVWSLGSGMAESDDWPVRSAKGQLRGIAGARFRGKLALRREVVTSSSPPSSTPPAFAPARRQQTSGFCVRLYQQQWQPQCLESVLGVPPFLQVGLQPCRKYALASEA